MKNRAEQNKDITDRSICTLAQNQCVGFPALKPALICVYRPRRKLLLLLLCDERSGLRGNLHIPAPIFRSHSSFLSFVNPPISIFVLHTRERIFACDWLRGCALLGADWLNKW